jgi:methionyl-tRNA synthetase
MSKFFLTTPIYYVNDKPHIGHTYTTVAADALARFRRLQGEDVLFVTGTDENSQKNVQAMEKARESDLTAYLDRMSGAWKATWHELGITIDDFIRTTEPRHIAGVNRFWEAVQKSGDLEKRTYTGLYCVGCEGFKVESDLVNGRCPLHPNKDLEKLEEENWFFKLTNYREALLAYIDANPQFIQPEARRTEIRSYVDKFMTDVSVSREAKKLSVGIPVPHDADQRIYVWFDALLNYLTVAGYGTDEAAFLHWWPADVHLVGKDIIKFHCALWPAMLMSAAKQDASLRHADGSPKLPKQVFAHGFFTLDGQKISKSLGNAIDPRDLVPTYGFDAIRYFLLREIPFGEDGDFSVARLRERYTADLGNTLGNLVNRAIAMSRKYFDGKVPNIVDKDKTAVTMIVDGVMNDYSAARCDCALERIWEGLYLANKYIEETQPFKLVKTDPDAVAKILYTELEACRIYAWLINPVMPNISRSIFEQLGLDAETELAKGWKEGVTWGGLKPGSALPEPKILFPRLPEA